MTTDTTSPDAASGGPLAGVRVLDLSWVLAGPYCTMVLSDLGADVVKCERPPFGDVARTTGPLLDGESGYFFSINRGKRSIAIDLKLDEGRELFLRLVPEFDVIVENFRPGTLERLGLGYERLAEVHPKLVYLAISGYGQDGPMRDRPALDVVVQGAGGVMSITGEPGGPPIRPGLSLGDIAGGLFGAIGVLSALRERDQSGIGQFVDVSMLDCQLAVLENAFLRYHLTGETPQPMGTRHSWAVPFQAFPTADGHLVIALSWGVPNQWALLCSELGLVELIDDPRFAESHQRSANHAELEPLLNEAFRTAHHGGLAGTPRAVRDPVWAGEQHRRGGRAPTGGGARDAGAGRASEARHAAAGEHAGEALTHARGHPGCLARHGPALPRGARGAPRAGCRRGGGADRRPGGVGGAPSGRPRMSECPPWPCVKGSQLPAAAA